jgi:hypothetical protein
MVGMNTAAWAFIATPGYEGVIICHIKPAPRIQGPMAQKTVRRLLLRLGFAQTRV